MGRRAWLVGSGAVLIGVVAFAVLVQSKRTPFEEGYGLDRVDRSITRIGTGDFVVRTYASQEPVATTSERVHRAVGQGPTTVMGTFRSWTVPEGEVQILTKPMVGADDWPKDATCVLVTFEPAPVSRIQRFVALLGIKQ